MSDDPSRSGSTDDAPLVHAKHPGDDATLAAGLGIAQRGDSTASWAVTVARPRDDLFRWWLDQANLAAVMENVVRIEPLGAGTSRWTVKGPGGTTFSFESAITETRDGALIAWASRPDESVPNSGRVTFRDAGRRGTVVTATMLYDPPGGAAGKLLARLFQREPAIQLRRDLCRFKQLMETGEIATNARTRAEHHRESSR